MILGDFFLLGCSELLEYCLLKLLQLLSLMEVLTLAKLFGKHWLSCLILLIKFHICISLDIQRKSKSAMNGTVRAGISKQG